MDAGLLRLNRRYDFYGGIAQSTPRARDTDHPLRRRGNHPEVMHRRGGKCHSATSGASAEIGGATPTSVLCCAADLIAAPGEHSETIT